MPKSLVIDLVRGCMKFNALKVVIVQTANKADTIVAEIDLPNPSWPYTGNCNIKMMAACGTGVEYVKKHFHCPKVQVVNK